VVPVLVGRLQERATRRATRRGDEVVNAAELRDGRLHKRLDVRLLGQVALLGDDLAGRDLAYFLPCVCQSFLVAAVDYDVRPFAGERRRRCFPESTARCRYQYGVAF